MNINEKIKKRRLEEGLSLQNVADVLGVNKSTVLRYESADIEKMPIDIIPKLAVVLKTSPEYLMGWDESETLREDALKISTVDEMHLFFRRMYVKQQFENLPIHLRDELINLAYDNLSTEKQRIWKKEKTTDFTSSLYTELDRKKTIELKYFINEVEDKLNVRIEHRLSSIQRKSVELLIALDEENLNKVLEYIEFIKNK